MSGKVQKLLRKEAKKRLEEQLQTMQPKQNPQQQVNILAELDQFLISCEILTGEKPSTMVLSDVAYNAYIQMVNNNAESLGLNPGFKNNEPTFRGVKLLKKSPIVVPTPEQTAQVAPEVKPN